MKKRDYYNYNNDRFAFLRKPMRNVMKAYGEAERYFAFIKEITWAEFGLKATTDYIHSLEHIQPEYVDEFKEIMAQLGLMVEYPSIDELAEPFEDLDKVFEVCVGIIDETDKALCNFVREVDIVSAGVSNTFALARQVETLIIKNSEDRKFLLEAWSMWDNNPSYTSFDNWVEHHAPNLKNEGEDD